jgi:hypothetical protein
LAEEGALVGQYVVMLKGDLEDDADVIEGR